MGVGGGWGDLQETCDEKKGDKDIAEKTVNMRMNLVHLKKARVGLGMQLQDSE